MHPILHRAWLAWTLVRVAPGRRSATRPTNQERETERTDPGRGELYRVHRVRQGARGLPGNGAVRSGSGRQDLISLVGQQQKRSDPVARAEQSPAGGQGRLGRRTVPSVAASACRGRALLALSCGFFVLRVRWTQRRIGVIPYLRPGQLRCGMFRDGRRWERRAGRTGQKGAGSVPSRGLRAVSAG